MKKLMGFFKDEEGAAGVEYGILVAAVAALIIALIFAIGHFVQNAFSVVNSSFDAQPGL